MTSLRIRLIINIAATLFIGFALVHIVFALFLQKQMTREREMRLKMVAFEYLAKAPKQIEAQKKQLQKIARKHQMVLTLLFENGQRISTLPQASTWPEFSNQQISMAEGYEHWAMALTDVQTGKQIIVSRNLDSIFSQVFYTQIQIFLLLFLIALFMLWLGNTFLRKVVVQPVIKMTRILEKADRAGLAQFEVSSYQDFAKLSRAMLDMIQQIESDRTCIQEQLLSLSQAHQELRQTQAQLVRAEKLALVGQLAAGIAHEIGNPLTILNGYMEIIKTEGYPTHTKQETFERMGKELDRIHIIIRDLLDFSRVRDSAQGSALVDEVIQYVIQLVEPQERMQHISINYCPSSTAALVAIEASSLTQVMVNMLFNAADAIKGKGEIRMQFCTQAEQILIQIDDSGAGIDSDKLPHIFEPFYTTKTAGTGIGLGLAVCEHIISSAGGDIQVEASELGGAQFTIKLPVSKSLE